MDIEYMRLRHQEKRNYLTFCHDCLGTDKSNNIKVSELYKVYLHWIAENQFDDMNRGESAFCRGLITAGYELDRSTNSFIGLRLLGSYRFLPQFSHINKNSISHSTPPQKIDTTNWRNNLQNGKLFFLQLINSKTQEKLSAAIKPRADIKISLDLRDKVVKLITERGFIADYNNENTNDIYYYIHRELPSFRLQLKPGRIYVTMSDNESYLDCKTEDDLTIVINTLNKSFSYIDFFQNNSDKIRHIVESNSDPNKIDSFFEQARQRLDSSVSDSSSLFEYNSQGYPIYPESSSTNSSTASSSTNSSQNLSGSSSSIYINQLCCPISLEPFIDPVVTCDGITYERKHIEKWFENHDTSPSTGLVLANKNLIPNFALKQ